MKTKRNYFRITNFYIAAFLFAKGLELINVDKSNPKRSEFVFLDNPERELFLNAFNFSKEETPDAMVDSRKMIFAIKKIKELIYQDKF